MKRPQPLTTLCCRDSSREVSKVSFLSERPGGIGKEGGFVTSCSPSKLKPITHEARHASPRKENLGNGEQRLL